jgi:hypothetical protein
MLKFILLGLVAVVGLFALVAAFQPSDFRVTRTATIAAPPAVVFEQVNTLKNWDNWSPWAKLDPNCQQAFTGPASGVGSAFAWAGNSKVGEGKMTITESQSPSLVKMNLEFIKPFAGTNVTEFTFQPQGDATAVTWTMSGKNNFAGKCFSLVMSCDKMVGGDFEKGLASMKAVAEAKK